MSEHVPFFFAKDRPVKELTDGELMTEWYTLPASDGAMTRFHEVTVELDRRAVQD